MHIINSPSLTYICCHTLVARLATNDLTNMIQPEAMGSDTWQIVRATVCPLPGALAYLTVLEDLVKTLVWTNIYLDLCDTIHTEPVHTRTHAHTHARWNQTASIASRYVVQSSSFHCDVTPTVSSMRKDY